MSSQGPWYSTGDAPATSRPGLSFQHGTSYDSYRKVRDEDSPTRLESLDLTTTRDTYNTNENWTELQQYPTSKRSDSYTQKLIQPRIRRSSTASSTSSNSTLVRQHRTVKWLDAIGGCIAAFWKLPIIRHFLWPFKWLNRAFTQRLANSRFHGWRIGILLGCIMSTFILGVNITVLILGATRGDGFRAGLAVPMSGLATEVSWWNSAIHIAINALSTAMLAASNYTMQVLSSPTREDIDKAHAKQEHLDIGVLSIRNLGRIPKKRLFLFLLMGLSSIPIHLFYNSAVFYIGANNEYNLHVFQNGSAEHAAFSASHREQDIKVNGSSFDMIQTDRWTSVYDTPLVSYGDLFLMVDMYRSQVINDTLSGWPNNYPNIATSEFNDWNQGNRTFNLTQMVVRESCTRDNIASLMDQNRVTRQWISLDEMFKMAGVDQKNVPKYAHVAAAYATRLNTASRIQLSFVFLIVVIICNTIKLMTMIWVVSVERKEYVVTLGDGAASFLAQPDPATERMCIASREDITFRLKERSKHQQHDDHLSKLVTHNDGRWISQYTTYSSALNKDRQIASYFIFAVVGVLFIGLIITAATRGDANIAWGTKSDNTFLQANSTPKRTLINAWIANAPQLVLSFCYLAINSECTAMASAAEWNSYASTRKGLRVTRPRGQQRDTYFLQLPYKWSLPLTAASGGLHWLLSQSIFLIRIDTYDREGNLVNGVDAENKPKSQSACGFSGPSWMAMSVSFLVLVGIVGLIGRKKFKIKLPFAAGSSLVISAACHTDEIEPHLRPVRWGVVERTMYDEEKHCSLSAGHVSKPKVGEKYL